VVLRQVLEPLVVVIDRDREDLLGRVLPDHILIKDLPDLAWGRQVGLDALAALVGGRLLANDVVAQLDALVADEHRGAGDEFAHLVLALAAERAVQQFFARRGLFRHGVRCSPWTPEPRPRCRTLPRLGLPRKSR